MIGRLLSLKKGDFNEIAVKVWVNFIEYFDL